MKRKLLLLSTLLILGVGGLTSCKGQITIDITTNSGYLEDAEKKDNTDDKEFLKYKSLDIK